MFMKLKFRSLVTLLAFISTFLFGGIRISDPEFIEVFRLKYFDILQRYEPRETKGNTYTVIIDIDEKSLREIGQWPWSRNILAELFKKSGEAGMLVIGLDVLFPEKDRTSPEFIAKNLKKDYPELHQELLKLPSNEEIAVNAMNLIPVVLGHSAISEVADFKRKDVKDTSVKAILGEDPKKKWLKQYPGLLANVPEFEKASSGAGIISLSEEPDGIIRRIPIISNIDNKIRPTLALEMIRVAFKGNSIASKTGLNGIEEVIIQTKTIGRASIPTDAEGRVWVHYGVSDKQNPKKMRYYVSASDIIQGKVSSERLKGKLGILGTSAIGLKDIKPTSVDKRMPGVEIHANLIDTIISAILHYSSKKKSKEIYNSSLKSGLDVNEAIKRADQVKIIGSPFLKSGVNMPFYESIFIIILGLIFTFSSTKFGPVLNISFFSIIVGAAFYVSLYLYTDKKILFDPTFAAFSSFIIYFSTTFANYLRDANEKRQIRGAFSQYLSPALVEQLAADPNKLVLGGETKKMTFLFCDVRGFTTISESFKSDPQGLTKLINRFLTPLTNKIIFHNGTIDKYMGDCIMAFWNAPLNSKDHESLACSATLEMHAALIRLNEERKKEAEAANAEYLELKIGIGINTGECVVGNMGSDQRFDYSVLGDSVNLASRLEGQSKGYGVKTVIGEETNNLVHHEFATLKLDKIAVKGKKEAVSIFTLLGDSELRNKNEFKFFKEQHEKILSCYFNKQWDEALKIIKNNENLLNRVMKEYYNIIEKRILNFKNYPPPELWDGVFVATTK